MNFVETDDRIYSEESSLFGSSSVSVSSRRDVVDPLVAVLVVGEGRSSRVLVLRFGGAVHTYLQLSACCVDSLMKSSKADRLPLTRIRVSEASFANRQYLQAL